MFSVRALTETGGSVFADILEKPAMTKFIFFCNPMCKLIQVFAIRM